MQRDNKVVRVFYTNWKGETSVRHLVPIRIFFGANEWHTREQWLLYAFDVDKNVERTFALNDVHAWNPSTENVDLFAASRARHLSPTRNGFVSTVWNGLRWSLSRPFSLRTRAPSVGNRLERAKYTLSEDSSGKSVDGATAANSA